MGAGAGQSRRVRSETPAGSEGGITPLEGDEKARWELAADATRQLAQSVVGPGKKSEADITAALAQLRQISKNMDLQRMLNALHVPEDSGEYEEALKNILLRIPDGWGRWVSCDKGWYPLVVGLDQQLAQLDPDYEVHQVKEKFGNLRYYAEPSGLRVVDESIPEPQRPSRDFAWESEEVQAWNGEMEAWQASQDAYRETPEGSRRVSEASAKGEAFQALIRAAEARSAHVCELCGADAEMRMTKTPGPWYKTICADCAASDLGGDGESRWLTKDGWDAWWEEEEPRYETRRREDWRERNAGKRFAVLASSAKRLGVDATYIDSPDAAAALASEDGWDGVFVGDDEVGRAYLDALAEHHAEVFKKNRETREAAWAKSDNNYEKEKAEGVPHLYSIGRFTRDDQLITQDLGHYVMNAGDECFGDE